MAVPPGAPDAALALLGAAVARLEAAGNQLLTDAGQLPGTLGAVRLVAYTWDDDETEYTLAGTLLAGSVQLELQSRECHGEHQDEFRVGTSRWRALPVRRPSVALAAALAEAEQRPGRVRRWRTRGR